ncbi:epoxyqueuosine reductase QueH [Adlercreutzia sp. ZJ141]|uniref:epoxyqueuosine reductase QueH n=1 Tax=Adlercreutzia sp. ZJ141 TaxID=2709406 RepID=UPI0013EA4A8A|nr:epoxyqueuosine reductase QueH [Adlercreutzia sp. ZJ141]
MENTTEKPCTERVLLHACCGPCSTEPTRLLRTRGIEPTIFFANSNIHPKNEYERRLDTIRTFAEDEGISLIEGSYDASAWERTAGRVGDAAHERFGLIADEHAAEFARTKDTERAHMSNVAVSRDESSSHAKGHDGRHTEERDATIADCSRATEGADDVGGANVPDIFPNPLDDVPNVGATSSSAREARAARCRACYRMRFEEAAHYAAAHGFDALGTTLSVSPYQHTQIIREELERAASSAGIRALFEDYRPSYDDTVRRSKDAGMYRQNYCGCRFSEEEARAERTYRKVERKAHRIAEKLAEAEQKAACANEPYVDPASPNGAFVADPLPAESLPRIQMEASNGARRCNFKAFDTVIELITYGNAATCEHAFFDAVDACRAFERRLSPYLPHSDIARLNKSAGEPCTIHEQTAELLLASKRYCAKSNGTFDITMGPVISLWDFHTGLVADERACARALEHVNWRKLNVFRLGGQWFAHLADPHASVNLGGIAKGWIADRLADIMMRETEDVQGISVNLGGNVLVRGDKPDGSAWRIGIRDPRDTRRLIGAVPVRNMSLVTSGTYERCFKRDGVLYHHILSTEDGKPVATDIAGATVVARDSIDAEGFSTTLLALGSERASQFAQREPAIIAAFLVGFDGSVISIEKDALVPSAHPTPRTEKDPLRA